jgi:uncharacterized protein (DUF488 family)
MIHTIGHSNHSIGQFVSLLLKFGIEIVADVRSTPYSRFNPQFGRDRLQRAMASAGMQYLFLGKELGARSQDPACYDAEGRVSYARLAATDLFRSGIERVRDGMRAHRVALMCAEREPLECHRTILVARELEREGVAIAHILADGMLEDHSQAMLRLADSLKLTQTDLFRDPADRIEQAYDLQAARIAYAKKAGQDATKRAQRGGAPRK